MVNLYKKYTPKKTLDFSKIIVSTKIIKAPLDPIKKKIILPSLILIKNAIKKNGLKKEIIGNIEINYTYFFNLKNKFKKNLYILRLENFNKNNISNLKKTIYFLKKLQKEYNSNKIYCH
ncbi:MAG: hypothetical protein PHN22_03605, partial [Candidatus ainarchaeum sp.]|nr:hypothetical protein [Candidatus ainarchaeum sp.]